METSYQRPRLARPFRQRFRAFARFVCGLIVLVASAAVLVWLFDRESAVTFRGIVDSGAENVGPVEAARIVAIPVVPGQKVKKGDVLVRFDSAERLLDESLSEVKLRESEQSLARAHENLIETRRRCRQTAREAAVALEERRMERLRESSELAGLDAEIARIQPLVAKKLVSELELTTLRPKADALRRTVAGYEPLLVALSNRLAQAEADLVEIDAQIRGQSSGGAHAANAALQAALKRYDELRRADASVLKASADGVVSQVFRRAGDIVAAGDTVVRVAFAPEERTVTGMLPAGHLDDVHVGDELVVTRAVVPGRGSPVVSAKGHVQSIDLEVLDFFDPMNSAPRTPVRGRKVRIHLPKGAAGFIPGETVLITKEMKL